MFFVTQTVFHVETQLNDLAYFDITCEIGIKLNHTKRSEYKKSSVISWTNFCPSLTKWRPRSVWPYLFSMYRQNIQDRVYRTEAWIKPGSIRSTDLSKPNSLLFGNAKPALAPKSKTSIWYVLRWMFLFGNRNLKFMYQIKGETPSLLCIWYTSSILKIYFEWCELCQNCTIFSHCIFF